TLDWIGGVASAGSGWPTISVVVASVAASRCSAAVVADSAPFGAADGNRGVVCPERWGAPLRLFRLLFRFGTRSLPQDVSGAVARRRRRRSPIPLPRAGWRVIAR